MIPIDASAEEGVIETLQRTGSCSLDDLVIQLPNGNEMFVAVDRMSRDSQLLLRASLTRLLRSHFTRGTCHPVHSLASGEG